MTSPAESPQDHQMVLEDDQNMPQGLNSNPRGAITASDLQSPGPAAPEQPDGTVAGSAEPPAAPGKPQGFLGEFWDAVPVRTVSLIIGILLLQIGFILSYVGAFHAPTPHRIPLAIVAPAPESGPIVTKLNLIPSAPLHATAASSPGAARRLLGDESVSAALVINPAATTDTLLVASADGSAEASAAEQVITAAEASQHRSVTVTDIVPLQRGDFHGLTGYYLVIGWIVGGYLVAALLGVASDAKRATRRRTIFRLIAFVPYAIISGLAGAIVVGPVLGALTGHLLALWWLGALLVFAVGAVTLAFQTLFGVIGIGVTILVFVILGNPSARRRLPARPAAAVLAGHQLGPAQRRRYRHRAPHRLLRRLRHRRPSDPPRQLCRRRGHHRPHRVQHPPASRNQWLAGPRTAAPHRRVHPPATTDLTDTATAPAASGTSDSGSLRVGVPWISGSLSRRCTEMVDLDALPDPRIRS